MPHQITSTEREQMAEALGISEKRYQEIANSVRSVMDQHRDIRYTEIAECVSKRLDLTTNEIFFLGVMIGGYVQFRAIVDGMIQVIPEEINIPKEMKGRPVVKSSTMAMA